MNVEIAIAQKEIAQFAQGSLLYHYSDSMKNFVVVSSMVIKKICFSCFVNF